MSTNQRLNWLLQQIQSQTATPEELKEVMDLLEKDSSGAVRQQLDEYYATHLVHADPAIFQTAFWEAAITEVLEQDKVTYHDQEEEAPVKGKVTGKVTGMRRWWWAAAAVLILLSGAYVWMNQKAPVDTTAQEQVKPVKKEGIPGQPGAILTLADGSKVVLDSLGNGKVATQKGTEVVLNDGQLTYNAANAEAASYNTMSTPKGREFQIQLPDGTKAWLNAASSITYPTAFTGNERKVSITGEVYFEVATLHLVTGQKMPFKVAVNDRAQVEVLGTHFNINAYTDETAIRTSLFEGAVRVSSGANAIVIKPGQQAKVNNASSAVEVIDDVDMDKVMAWKNGLFNFEGAHLEEVMKQLVRWYDIEVVYEKGIPDIEFVGEMSKNINLKDLLEILKKTKVHFKLEDGNRLIVTP